MGGGAALVHEEVCKVPRVKVVVVYMDGLKVKGKQARQIEEKRWEELQREVGGEGMVLLGDLNTTWDEKGWACQGTGCGK